MASKHFKKGCPAVAYIRVSTVEQAGSGLGMDAQTEECRRLAAEKDWPLAFAQDTGVSGGVPPEERPALGPVLEGLAAGEYRALIASSVDRLGRGWVDVARLFGKSVEEKWTLLVGGIGDMDDDMVQAHFQMMVMLAHMERSMIRRRTREALAAAKARGQRLGRPVLMPDDVRRRVWNMRQSGLTYAAIAEKMEEEKILTATGCSQWHKQTVLQVVRSVDLDMKAEAARTQSQNDEAFAFFYAEHNPTPGSKAEIIRTEGNQGAADALTLRNPSAHKKTPTTGEATEK